MSDLSTANRILYVADNLRVMRGMNSESVDLIATDPPFDTKKMHNAQFGSRAAGQQFKDRWQWDEVTDEWNDLIAVSHPAIREIIEAATVIEGGSIDRRTGRISTGRIKNSIAAFLVYMAPRIVEMHRILKPTGSIYLHCNHRANSYLRLLMDAVFGRNNFRNEIVWCYTQGGRPKKDFPNKHDIIFRYSKSKRYIFNNDDVKIPYELISSKSQDSFTKKDDDGRYYKEVYGSDKKKKYKYYKDQGKIPYDWWTDIPQITGRASSSKKTESTGWLTQKPLALYERIIRASSNPDDLVFDPFCGCATTCVIAERMTPKRRWIGIDIDPVAETVTRDRLFDVSGLDQMAEYEDDDTFMQVRKNPPNRTDIPKISNTKMRLSLWNKQAHKCANPYCSSDVLRAEDLELDHVIPKSRGGADDVMNRIGLCGNCNRRKGRKAWGAFLNQEQASQPHPTVGQ